MQADFESMLQAQISELTEQRDRLNAELVRVEGHLDGLRHALALFRGESPQSPRETRTFTLGTATETSQTFPLTSKRAPRVPDPSRSAAWAFALEKMEHAPPEGIHINDLNQALANAGHAMSRVTLRANLSNAAKEGIIERVSYGRYRKPREPDDHMRPAQEPAHDDSPETQSDAQPSRPIPSLALS